MTLLEGPPEGPPSHAVDKPRTERVHLNPDLACLRCGAFNIRDNIVCGHCGANLPIVYDSEGNARVVTDDVRRFSSIVGKSRGGDPSSRGEGVRWIIRFGLILVALAVAVWLMSRGR